MPPAIVCAPCPSRVEGATPWLGEALLDEYLPVRGGRGTAELVLAQPERMMLARRDPHAHLRQHAVDRRLPGCRENPAENRGSGGRARTQQVGEAVLFGSRGWVGPGCGGSPRVRRSRNRSSARPLRPRSDPSGRMPRWRPPSGRAGAARRRPAGSRTARAVVRRKGQFNGVC